MSRPRLLITGAGGLLGHALCTAAATAWDVVALYHCTRPKAPGVTAVSGDITSTPDMDHIFRSERPQAVIHAAAMSQPNACEVAPETSEAVNVAATTALAARCADAGIPMVFTSTDLVFDGTRPPYRETDPVTPICVYGRHKAEAEKRLAAAFPAATVCRMPLMFGFAPSGGGFLGELVRTLSAGGRPRLFTDEIRTPVSTTAAARGLLAMLDQSGRIFHLGGGRRVSRYRFGRLVAASMGLPADRIIPIRSGDLDMPAPRSPDVSLVSRDAGRCGFAPGCFEADLAAAVSRYAR